MVTLDSTPVLRQKVTIPFSGSTTLPRTRLYNFFSQRQEKIIAVVAPPGYGKSVFLANWVRITNTKACWYSLDIEDNHRVKFLRYLIESIRTLFPTFGGSLIKQLNTSQPQIEQILAQFIQKLSELNEKVHLILDDFHFITNPEVHKTLNYLIVYLPQNVSLILSSRTTLPIPLTKIKLNNQFLEIGIKELAFTYEETSHLLQSYQLCMDEEQTKEIYRQTEGWVAGIQLIALSFRQAPDHSLKSVHPFKHDIHDYLFEEVFQSLSKDMQQFLLLTSVLEQLQENLCNEVTCLPDSYIYLEQLIRDNLFLIPLDNDYHFYRYHHLFSDFLRNRLYRANPKIIETLHSRAANWFKTNGHYADALKHELKAKNYVGACSLLVKLAPTMLKQGNVEQFLYMINLIPFTFIKSSPFLLVYYCWALSLSNRIDEAFNYIQFLEKQMDDGVYSPEDRHALFLEVCHFHGHISFLKKNFADVLKYRMKISDYLPYESDILKSIDFNPNHMYLSRGFMGSYGDFASSSALFAKIIDYIEQGFPIENTIWGLLASYLGELHFEKNKLEKAEAYLINAMQVGQKETLAGIYIPSLVTFIHLKKLQNPTYPIEGAIKDLKQFIHDCDMPQWQLAIDAFKIRMDIRDGKNNQLENWLEVVKLFTEGTLTLEREYEYLTLCRVWIALGKTAEVIALIDRLYIAADSENKYGTMIELLMLKAMAFDKQSKPTEAKSSLLKALHLGMEMGWFMTFVFEGTSFLPLLAEMMAEENNEPFKMYINKIVMLIKNYPSSAKKENDTLDDLTNREFEILTLIAQGLSNNDISVQLSLTIGTVKGYCNRIYQKLQVDNRTQASLLFNQMFTQKV